VDEAGADLPAELVEPMRQERIDLERRDRRFAAETVRKRTLPSLPANEIFRRQRPVTRASRPAHRRRHDAVHVRSLDLQYAQDIAIFERAAAEESVIVSADAHFGTLLATRAARRPSIVQFRGPGSRKPDALARTLLANLPQFSEALDSGAS
jgi:predicted nuclease of predicted toxin-antitoxin system